MWSPIAIRRRRVPVVTLSYSTRQIASQLQVSLATVRRWIASGRLQAIRPGSTYRITATELTRFIERNPSHAVRR